MLSEAHNRKDTEKFLARFITIDVSWIDHYDIDDKM